MTDSDPTFGDYDPNEIVKDGPFRASRKWQHILKVLTALTADNVARAIALSIPAPWYPWWLSLAMGPLILLFVHVKEAIRPTDPAKHTLTEKLLDTLTDGACYSTPAVLYYVRMGLWLPALMLAGVLYSIYRFARHGARP